MVKGVAVSVVAAVKSTFSSTVKLESREYHTAIRGVVGRLFSCWNEVIR
jgi:hypothetical protein